LSRKTLIRHMNSRIARKPRRKQRRRTYGHQLGDAWRVISENLDHMCAERLTRSLVPAVILPARHGETQVSPSLLVQLGHIRVSTMRRRLEKTDGLQLCVFLVDKAPSIPSL